MACGQGGQLERGRLIALVEQDQRALRNAVVLVHAQETGARTGKLQVHILSGAGGQGLILAGAIVAEAAGVFEGKEVVQTQSYGIQARGGASQSSVIISDGRIKYPEVLVPDILLCLSQEAYNKYSPSLREGGILIVDQDLVTPTHDRPDIQFIALPFTAQAEKMERRILANVIALGALATATGEK